MPAEFNAKYIAPVREYFSFTANRAATFDLIVTLRWALAEGENLPESIQGIYENLVEEFGDTDMPEGVAPLAIPDSIDESDDGLVAGA